MKEWAIRQRAGRPGRRRAEEGQVTSQKASLLKPFSRPAEQLPSPADQPQQWKPR